MNNITPQNYPFDSLDEDNIDIKRYISLFISNWYWFAGALLIAMGLAYGINRYSEKIYTVSSSLLIKDDQIASTTSSISNVIPGGDIFRSQQNLINEMGILRSYSLNYKVMEDLPEFQVVYVSVGRRGIVETRMYKNSPFKIIYESIDSQPHGVKIGIKILSEEKFILSIDSELRGQNVEYNEEHSFGDRFNDYGFDFVVEKRFPGTPVIEDEGSNNYWFYFVGKDELASQYRNKLNVAPIEEEASLVSLSVSGSNVNQESDYLNKLMDVYIRYGLENKNQTADSTIKFIEGQISVIVDSLTIAERQLESFRQANRFINISSEGNYIQNRLERFENEKAALELQKRYYEYLKEYLESKSIDGTIISPSVMGITDQVLIKLVNDLLEIHNQIAEIGFNINNEQGAYNLVTQHLEQTRLALKENIDNGLSGLDLSIIEVNKRIESVDKELANLPSTERQLINIERNFDLNNTVYTYLLEKRSESEIARASNVSDNRIIDKAAWHSTTLIRPKKRQNTLIAISLGLILPAIALIVLDFLNDKILDKKDIERRTKVPIVGYISHNDIDSNLPVLEKPGSALAESFRSVRTAIKYFVNDEDKAVIAVSSTISSEGKSFISANLATIIAMLGKKVLLVGLDLRKPRLGRVFSSSDDIGMSTFLSKNSNFHDIIKSTHVENLSIVQSGPIPPNPAELIEGDRMRLFIEQAKEMFDYIVFDTPPVGIVTDTLLLSPYVNMNLFIVRQRYSARNTLELIEQLREQGQIKNMGIVINDIKLTGYYGYGIRYGGYSYGYHYGYNYYGNGYYGKYGYGSKESKGYYID
jgi:capsular exopolysaccharide synthesis family protein